MHASVGKAFSELIEDIQTALCVILTQKKRFKHAKKKSQVMCF